MENQMEPSVTLFDGERVASPPQPPFPVQRSPKRGRIHWAWFLIPFLGLAILTNGLSVADRNLRQVHARLQTTQARLQTSEVNLETTQGKLVDANTNLQDLQADIRKKVGDLDHPHLAIWTAPQTVQPGHYLSGGIPDTFTWHAALTSSAPIGVWIMTLPNYACWQTNACSVHAVRSWGYAMHIDATFSAASGCAAYVAVIVPKYWGSARVVPDVGITYDPAARGTGACSGPAP